MCRGAVCVFAAAESVTAVAIEQAPISTLDDRDWLLPDAHWKRRPRLAANR